jgi:hypothetical protein
MTYLNFYNFGAIFVGLKMHSSICYNEEIVWTINAVGIAWNARCVFWFVILGAFAVIHARRVNWRRPNRNPKTHTQHAALSLSSLN